jgi:hypothetical protein
VLTFDKFDLKTNPFRLIPAINSEELIWAGFPEIKGKLENRIKRFIQIPNSCLILNHGEYGSGKTHAARYFNKRNVLREIAGAINRTPPFSLNVKFPKSKQPVWDIYCQIIDQLDIDDIRATAGLHAKTHESSIADIINLSADNFYVGNVLKAMFNPAVDIRLLKQFLYNRISNADLKKFPDDGIQRTFSSDNDIAEFLATFFSLIAYQKSAYSCVILWLDEFEDISVLNSVNINSINNFIKIIVDRMPGSLLIFLNLTQSAMIGAEDLDEYLQESVKSRIRDRIEFSMPDKEDLKLYLKDLLNHPLYRKDGANDYFPFEEAVVDRIAKDLGAVSLRRFNEAFSLLLESALFDEKDIIDTEYYESNKEEIIGWKN